MDLASAFLAFYILFLVSAGYLLPFVKERKRARLCAWIIAVATILMASMFVSHRAPLPSMLIIVFLQLLSMKILVAVETYTGENKLTAFQWSAFALGWFGMRPTLFERLPSKPLSFLPLILKGISRIFLGFLVLYLSTYLEQYSILSTFFLPQLLLLTGLSLVLHFGILNLSAALWRGLGVNANELFQAPYKSKSLQEFWGRRWNMAFSEMTALIAYRPLKSHLGIEKAIIVSFLLSGLLHELAISLPVKTGYGLPMIYFVIHAGAMHLEKKSLLVQRIVRHRVCSHLWVLALLVLPMPLLFHPQFIRSVLVPLRAVLLHTVGLL